jgi:RND family efflux transporter MFP subunit
MRLAAFLLSAVICASIGWVIYQDSLASTATEPKAKEVEVVAVAAVLVSEQTVEDRVELVGGLEAVTQVAIRSRVSGYLTGLSFDVGDPVDMGVVVVELDDKTTRELLSRAMAAERVAQAQLDAQKSREEQAQRQVQRYRTLGESGVSTDQQLEYAESAWAVARAEVKLEDARLSQAKADLERSRLALEELQIRSPLSGFVAERNVEVGDLARAEDILLRIVDLSTVRTVVNVVERDYGKVRVGQPASIRVDAVPGGSFPGIVVSKAPVLDPETRTARVMIEIRNPDLLLRPGMHARVTIVADRHRDALVIPLSAVLERDGEQFVYEVDADSTARRRTISTGIRDDDVIEVRQGLGPESRVITLGSRLVRDGSQLDVSPDTSIVSARIEQSTNRSDSATGE